MRFLCITSYKGTAYQGWQKQIGAPTVQSEIEKVLSQFFNQEITIQGSGRTDAGVHAYGQTFHFDIDKDSLDINRFLYSINQMLPNDISIKSIKQVSDDFHARFSAKGKHYIYKINYSGKDPFDYDEMYNCLLDFDHDKFSEMLTYFKGSNNYKNFTSKEEDEKDFVRNIQDIKVQDKNGTLIIDLIGDGFMRYMIRYIIGTALACSQGKISLDEVKELLDCKSSERKIVSFKAPAEGLYLAEVLY